MDYKEKVIALLNNQELSKEQYEKLENIFPELKESEGERIRKAIISGMIALKNNQNIKTFAAIPIDDCIAWLEKQSEKDPCIGCTNDKGCVTCENGNTKETKSEPKFHPGDWVVSDYNNVGYIESISGTKYNLRCKDGYHENISVEYIDRYWHLWTIQDAKDGDLIYVSTEIKGIQAIFHKFENGIIYFHCNLCSDFMQSGYEPSGDVKSVHPLLKARHQKFFQKMEEAGYEWDSEKKELKKMEVPSEDERMKREILELVSISGIDYNQYDEIKDWLEKQSKKMSADEVLKIRREVYQSGYNDGYKHGHEDKEKELSEQLIEKQGEQKSTDKAEPKIKVGGWL